jgi:chemotaxis signal transduction protein
MMASAPITSVCAFWFGERRYALPTTVIDSVVAVGQVAPVPLVSAGIRGVFSLRGAPVALVDMGAAFDLPAGEEPARSLAVVLRQQERVVAAIGVDRLDAVFTDIRATFTERDAEVEHPAVLGFCSTDGDDDVLTVLDPTYCMARLDALKFR